MKTAQPLEGASALTFQEDVLRRLKELEGALIAIDEGQLLSALPTGSEDRKRHQAAVSLLSILYCELHDIIDRLETSAPAPSLKRTG